MPHLSVISADRGPIMSSRAAPPCGGAAKIESPGPSSDRGLWTFGIGDAGFPRFGAVPGASLHLEIPYEDATSTEPIRLLSNGSPPPRGFLPWRDPTLPIPQAARAAGTARVVLRE